MKRGIMVLLAAVLVFGGLGFALDPTTLAYKMPAKYRLIYQIPVADLNENSNVIITVTIPESIYSHWIAEFNAGRFCDAAKNPTAFPGDFAYPVVQYASSANTTQRPYNTYEIVDSYAVPIANCILDGGQVYVHLPKTIKVVIPALDEGSVGYKNVEHYLLIYEPFVGVLFTFDHTPLGNGNYTGWLSDGKSMYNYVADRGGTFSISLSPNDRVFLRFTTNRYEYAGVRIYFTGIDGKTYAIQYGGKSDYSDGLPANYVYTTSGIKIGDYYDVIRDLTMRTGKPATYFTGISGIQFGISYGSQLTDIYLFKYPS